ncbi:peptidoglycan-associated lipoprotein Pal [Amaricoccus macauensis]|uniref:peptidoglycan-associated lipoprotein Pal n=1 Tax=Amaricoccus macauensis TaxID=57001 RepID=UPI003C7CE215
MKTGTVSLVATMLLAAACARQSDPVMTGPGFSGTDATLGANGANGAFGSGSISGGTLPGTQISDRVLFSVDQSTLSAEAIGILNQQISWLRQNPGAPILIEGHADERGTGEYNMALGASRASAVRNYMVTQGIADSRISIITYGRERPVATCAQDSCWAQNRRAVTVVTGGAGA